MARSHRQPRPLLEEYTCTLRQLTGWTGRVSTPLCKTTLYICILRFGSCIFSPFIALLKLLYRYFYTFLVFCLGVAFRKGGLAEMLLDLLSHLLFICLVNNTEGAWKRRALDMILLYWLAKAAWFLWWVFSLEVSVFRIHAGRRRKASQVSRLMQ